MTHHHIPARPRRIVEQLERLANDSTGDEFRAYTVAARLVAQHLDPGWIDLHDLLPDGYYRLASDPPDAPPRLLRSQVVSERMPLAWSVWTAAGWVPVTCRVSWCGWRPE